jgi:methionyl-tRNA formyltransferase
MMGTGPFAAPLFEALFATRHQVLALVTQPPREVRGKRSPPPSPLRAIAAAHGTPVLDPQRINTGESREQLRRLTPDLLVVADYGQILAPQTLAVARLGGINLHGSLLPKYRGAAPIQWAIYHGETETGVTVIHMTPQVDAGPCIAQARLAIGDDETAEELERRLAELGAPLVCQAIDRLQSGTATPLPQDPSRATRARRLKKDDGHIDWSRTAQQIKNHVRAMHPWPKCFTTWRSGCGALVRLIVGRVAVQAEAPGAAPGTILQADRQLVVAAGQGAVRVLELQPAGKRMMPAADFLRGHPMLPGQKLE